MRKTEADEKLTPLQKELLRRQGVLLSTIKGKEKEAAEEVVEALTPVSSPSKYKKGRI